MFKLKANFQPTGDQPKAIDQLTDGIIKGDTDQVLLGVTGSGKTYVLLMLLNVFKTNFDHLS
jgi:excinuclease ABC subunit B